MSSSKYAYINGTVLELWSNFSTYLHLVNSISSQWNLHAPLLGPTIIPLVFIHVFKCVFISFTSWVCRPFQLQAVHLSVYVFHSLKSPFWYTQLFNYKRFQMLNKFFFTNNFKTKTKIHFTNKLTIRKTLPMNTSHIFSRLIIFYLYFLFFCIFNLT